MSKNKLKQLQQQLITASDSGHYASTVTLANQYLALAPKSVKALLDKAHALAKLALYEEAQATYELALECLDGTKDLPDVIYGELGNLWRSRGDFTKATQYYQQQIEADPEDATGYLFLGTLQFQQGALSQSEQTLQLGIEKGSAMTGACLDELNFALGNTLRSLGKYKDAANCFAEALRLSPTDSLAKAALKDVRAL